jgi:hypothetical protein
MAEAKGNRVDLNNPAQKIARQAAPGQTYGKAGQQMASQAVVPMGSAPTDVAASRQSKTAPKPPTPITAPTGRPDEPITAGAPFGAGMGPVEAGIPMYNPRGQALEELRMIAQYFPSDDLEDLLSRYGM